MATTTRTFPATPAEFDTELVELHIRHDRAEQAVNFAKEAVRRAAGQRRVYVGRRQQWTAPFTEAVEALGAKHQTVIGLAVAELGKTELWAEAMEWTVEYAMRGGWTRFYAVPGGHIHSSDRCHTLRATTRIGLVPALSGQTEAEAVAELGPILCSVCFPTAPVEWRRDPAVVAAERRPAKPVKAGPFVTATLNDWKQTYKTRRSAEIAYVQHLAHHQAYDYRLDQAGLDVILDALAADGGHDRELLREQLAAKAAKKAKADARASEKHSRALGLIP